MQIRIHIKYEHVNRKQSKSWENEDYGHPISIFTHVKWKLPIWFQQCYNNTNGNLLMYDLSLNALHETKVTTK